MHSVANTTKGTLSDTVLQADRRTAVHYMYCSNTLDFTTSLSSSAAAAAAATSTTTT